MTKVYEVNSARLTVLRTHPPSLSITVEGNTSILGYSNFHLEHWIYITPPADGIYDADIVATPPTGSVLQVISPFQHQDVWENYPAENLKGMRIHSATNNVVTMLI
jgi:hypothetical protein